MKPEQVNELLYQALETELGGVEIYTTAIQCAVNEELKEEWHCRRVNPRPRKSWLLNARRSGEEAEGR